jgi:endonuclease-8
MVFFLPATQSTQGGNTVPEGPSLVILKEESARFVGQQIVDASGNTSAVDLAAMVGEPIVSLRSWGKHFLIELPDMALRIHFLLFGTWRINERREGKAPRLSLTIATGDELNLYACSVKEIDRDLDACYDWSADVMAEQWDPARARKKLRAAPDMLVCDALLDQSIFSGVGNIIKNEVLFRIRVHPCSRVGALPPAKLRALVEQARQYSFDFLGWKKEFVLKKHWLAHAKTVCPRCNIRYSKAHLGRSQRRSFFCERCQKRYE